MNVRHCFVLAIAALFSVGANAESLALKKQRKEADEKLKTYLTDDFKKTVANATVDLHYDEFEKSKAFKDQQFAHYQIADRCGENILGTLKEIAADPDAKDAFKKVKHIHCHFVDQDKLKTERSEGTAEIKGDTMHVKFNQDTSWSYNGENWFKKWAMNAF